MKLKYESIDKKFKEIDNNFNKISKQNKLLNNALIKPIHEKYLFTQNGICALIASMGSGKNYIYLKLISQQEVLFNEPSYELICICSTSNKFDETVNSFKVLIKKSKLIAISDNDLLDFLNKYMKRILKYNSIIKYINSDLKEVNEESERVFAEHKLNSKEKILKYISLKLAYYNWKTYPHRMLLVLDDFANHVLLTNKETDLMKLLKKLRHFNINVMICVQTVKSIPKDLKRTLSDIVLFPGISR